MLKEVCDVDEKWIRNTVNMLCKDPPPTYGKVSMEPLPGNIRAQKPRLFMKPPSARSGWQIGVCVGIQATKYNGPCGITREWSFISYDPKKKFSVNGDSGSPTLDQSGNIAAMIWGGSANKDSAIVDITWATPFYLVLESVEDTMGWERGSLVWCD